MIDAELRSRPRPRWWPAALIVAGGAAAMGWVWTGEAPDRQGRVVTSQSVLVAVGVALLAWLLLLSRLRWRTRLRAVAGLAVIAAGLAAALRYDGVDGDLMPVFSWRWNKVEIIRTGEKIDGAGPRLDYPQFLGEHRDGRVPGVRLARDWDAAPPVLIWRRPVGAGWSGFAVAGNRAVTQEQHGDEECVVCYDLATGEELWRRSDPVRYTSALAGDGPRATPTIHGGRVFSMGATGLVNALDLRTGERCWSREVFDEVGADVPNWGSSCSPLVHDGHVVVTGGGGKEGGTLVALDEETGDVVWRGGRDAPGYASPLVAHLAGRAQIIILSRTRVAGHDPVDGTLLWQQEWPSRNPSVAQPLPVGSDRLLVSAGYGIGARLFELETGDGGGIGAKLVWRSMRLKSKFANMILHEGFVYGLDDGMLTCIDVERGRRRWKSGRYGHGQLIHAGDVLLVMTESGEGVLVELDPQEHREVARHPLIDGKVWNPPALAGSLLLVRNDKEAALFRLPAVEG